MEFPCFSINQYNQYQYQYFQCYRVSIFLLLISIKIILFSVLRGFHFSPLFSNYIKCDNTTLPFILIITYFQFLAHNNSNHIPSKPYTYRQCLSILRERAIFSPSSVHTGCVRVILAKSALTAKTLPPVDKDPMFTMSISFFDSF